MSVGFAIACCYKPRKKNKNSEMCSLRTEHMRKAAMDAPSLIETDYGD